jgi:Tfp pilus assembly protein FimV
MTMKTRATVLGLVVVIGWSFALPAHLQAFSVGEIVVRSSRGVPFLGEVPLFLDVQERARGVTATLGDEREYRSEGLTRNTVVDSLVVKVISGAHDMIFIGSSQPVQEPSFEVLLFVRSGHITIVKTYHVVLPPPPAPSAPPVARAPAEIPPPPPAKVAASPSPPVAPKKALPKSTASVWSQRLPERYGPIVRGATLYSVVEEIGVPKDMFWQAIVLLWQANKQEFAGGNLHGLRVGMLLTIPSNFAESLATLSRAEAQRFIAEEWESWQALRQATSGQQHAMRAREETAVVTRKAMPPSEKMPTPSERGPVSNEPIPGPKDKPSSSPEPLVTSAGKTPMVGASVPVLPKEKIPSTAAVMLPASTPSRAVELAELRSVLQGLEELLTRRLPQTESTKGMATFVSAGELQTALQGLEERLMQRLQESLEQVTLQRRHVQPVSQAPVPVERASVLEAWLPTNTMAYVLAVENAFLLLLAIGILWRWYRSRA